MAYLSRETRRQQIMDAVTELVTHEGLQAATVRRIAQELGCSPGQIHHHFTSADALRAEAVREVWGRVYPDLTAALRRLPPRARLRVLLSGVSPTEELARLTAVARRIWREALDIRSDPSVRAALVEVLDEFNAEIAAALTEGIAAGNFPPGIDAERSTLDLVTAVQGFDLLDELGALGRGPDRESFVIALLRKEGIEV